MFADISERYLCNILTFIFHFFGIQVIRQFYGEGIPTFDGDAFLKDHISKLNILFAFYFPYLK